MPSPKSTGRTERGSDSPKSRRETPKTTTGKGWGAVANKKVASEESSFDDSAVRDFFMLDGEVARVQFLSEEPYCMDGHNVRNAKGKFTFVPCQLTHQKHCLMCSDGIKTTWKAAFLVLDYRGTWDKDKKDFKWDKPILKVWKVSNTVATQIQSQVEKRKKTLTAMVFDITRSGADKNTSYNFEAAFDEETDEKIKPMKWTEPLPDLEELCSPPSDKQLEAMGFESAD